MSRFDDDLRRAIAPLASEPMPPDVLDEALDEEPNRPRWTAMAAVVAVAAVLVLATGIGIGRMPSPSVSPSPGAISSEQPPPVAACEDVAAPSGGEDIVLVYFPCGIPPDLEPSNGTRSVARDMPVFERLETALRAVLDGPSELEQAQGMSGIVADGSGEVLVSVALAPDGLAQVDFAPALRDNNNLSTSAASGAFSRALRATALQFDEVTAVEFQIGGSCDAFFEYFQSSCQHFAKPIGPVRDCPIISPAELPSGAPITEPRLYPGQEMVSWGSGDDTVTELAGHRDGGPSVDGGTPVIVRGYPGSVQPSGDMPLPEPMQIGWSEDGCPYLVFVRFPGGEDAAVEYAGRFGPSMAQRSPPPGEPITASGDGEGIRLTITLDRDRTVFGQRILATATVENIGVDSVLWGHSSTCVYPVSLQIRPNEPVGLPYGRDDWPGDDGILKRVTVNDRLAEADPSYRFLPEEWLDYEGIFSCTDDLVTSEMAAGDSIVQRSGWDTLGYYDLPPAPGNYTVDAVFNFMSRGAHAAGDEEIDEFSVGLTLPVVVEGPEVDYVSPGDAFDALLSDEAYRAQLADAPRGRWLQSDIMFVDGHWETALYLSASDADVEPIEAIVAIIDARSGVVLDVRLNEQARPPG